MIGELLKAKSDIRIRDLYTDRRLVVHKRELDEQFVSQLLHFDGRKFCHFGWIGQLQFIVIRSVLRNAEHGNVHVLHQAFLARSLVNQA